MYEMQGTLPGVVASGQPWPGLPSAGAPPARARNPRSAQVALLLPRPGVAPGAVPVSNGESISTALARDGARPATHLFRALFQSTGCPQNMVGYPHSTAVFHRLLHKSSTGYQALPRGTLSCRHGVVPEFRGFLNSIS